jgi:DNA-directed RNA polymerase subunit L
VKINVLKKTKNELKIEIEGEGHTFCNLLQHTLLEDENIEIAGYDLPHPLISNPLLYIRVKGGKTPEKALKKALEKIRERTSEFLEKFTEAAGKTNEKGR